MLQRSLQATASSLWPRDAESRWRCLNGVVTVTLLFDLLALLPHAAVLLGPSSPFQLFSLSGEQGPLEFIGVRSRTSVLIFWWCYLSLLAANLLWPFRPLRLFLLILFGGVLSLGTSLSGTALVYGLHFYAQFLLVGIFCKSIVKDHGFVWQYLKVIFVLSYLQSGLSKLLTPAWCSGEVLWSLLDLHWPMVSGLVSLGVLSVFAIMGALIQILAPLSLGWPGHAWSVAFAFFHLVAGLTTGLYLFSVFMALLAVILFSGRNQHYWPIDLAHDP